MQKSVYFPDDEQTQEILKQIENLGEINRRSFSELVVEGLRLLIDKTNVINGNQTSTALMHLTLKSKDVEGK